MLRTELPHASRVVKPASARRRIASSASCRRTKWNWMFWRVVMWPNPREYCSATSASACSCARRDHALRNLDAHHLRVGGLTLPVGATQQAERAPLVRRDLAPLELSQQVGELVDVPFVGEREPCAAKCLRIVDGGHAVSFSWYRGISARARDLHLRRAAASSDSASSGSNRSDARAARVCPRAADQRAPRRR